MQRYGPGTALVVVDVQNDFADPDGSLSVAGGDVIVATVDREIEMAANGGAVIVATQDWHPPVTPHFAKDGGIWPVHCVANTWGAALHPGLALPDSAPRSAGATARTAIRSRGRDPSAANDAPGSRRSCARRHGGAVARPGDRRQCQGDRARCASARLRDGGPATRSRRSISSRDASEPPTTLRRGVTIWRTVMR